MVGLYFGAEKSSFEQPSADLGVTLFKQMLCLSRECPHIRLSNFSSIRIRRHANFAKRVLFSAVYQVPRSSVNLPK